MKSNVFKLSIAIFLAVLYIGSTSAQRRMEKLDRGVVAVLNSAGNYFVSWRYFATDPTNIQFNLYAKSSGASEFTKLNSTPLSQTSLTLASGALTVGSQICVKPVLYGVEGPESGIFTVSGTEFVNFRSGYLDVSFDPAMDGLAVKDYYTKYCWPVDLDGDGEYDFVVDRKAVKWGNPSTDPNRNTDKIQGYLRDGTLLWTIDMGPNCQIDYGSADMVTAYDMDGDGKGEVVIKSSDGTKFANGTYLKGNTSPDIDGDGIVDYETQAVRNPPYYITLVNGMTGNEKTSIEFDYSKTIYTRENKASFMSEEYNKLVGHMGIVYHDGKHPSVGYIYNLRTLDGRHNYYVSAWGYNKNGQFEHQYTWSRGTLDAAEGHGLKVADTDQDGRDEILDIGYGIKHDGSLLFNAHISHGDRFRIGDIDPERPGLETFAIQQNASSMLGQILYDAATGTPIKKWYLTSVGDVGRGECMDIDSTRLGYEMWSTMSNIYDAKGNILYEGSTPWPFEGIWWDGDLAREELAASDGSGYNADVRKYSSTYHSFGSRPIEFAKMTNWKVKSMNGVRPAFFGDIAGDWREEVVLAKRGSVSVTLKDVNGNDSIASVETCPGFVGFSTDYPTDKRLYCLMQNPAYRLQCTAKGYYQSSFPDYYLGYDMPTPPVAPVQKAKLTWASGTTFDKAASNFLLEDEKTTSTFADGDDVMFEISGDNSSVIQLTSDLAPSKVWAMNPKGKDYTLAGAGKLTGSMELVKSQNGTFTLNGSHTYTGKTLVSEGNLVVNGTLMSPVEIQAKGTLSGNAVLNGGITFNPALNIEGGRLAPGNGLAAGKLGKMTINSDVSMAGKVNVHIDVLPSDSYKNDSLLINGNLTATGINNIVINTESGVLPSGTYSLIHWTGSLTGAVENFAIEGISGLPMSLIVENNTLKLVVNATREAGNVTWTGNEGEAWDYLSANFKLNTTPTYFVNGDAVTFNEDATTKTVNMSDNLTTSGATFTNDKSTYVLKGTGGITGSGDLVKSGGGLLDIQTTNNSYTGKTILNNAVVQVASLADAGASSSLGAAAADVANITMTDSRLIVNAVSTNSNRGITLIGNDTINVPKSNGVVALNGLLTGTGKLVATGAGKLNISGTVENTYTGGTLISGAKVSLGTLLMNSKGFGSGAIKLENGATVTMYYNQNFATGFEKSTWALSVPTGHSATLITSGRCNIDGSISGGGTLTYNTTYTRADLLANCTNFTGTFIATGRDFRITANAYGLPAANVQLSDNVGMGYYSSIGASSSSSSGVVKLGSLSGVATSKVYGGIWQIGYNNQDAVFNGLINSGATVTKVGTGNWTLTNGAGTATSAFTVNGGKLTATNTSGSATGTGAVTVNAATLAGTGIITGAVTANSDAVIEPGNNSIGTLTVGALTMQTGSKMAIEVSGASSDKVVVTGALALKGTLEMTNIGTPYAAGNSYTIFSAASVTGSFDAISPASPGSGLAWNTSRISEGIISVDLTSGIDDVLGSGISVYPNPVKDVCNVTFGALTGQVRVELINVAGSVISSQVIDASAGHGNIDMGNLNGGVYCIKVTSGEKTYLRKVVKL